MAKGATDDDSTIDKPIDGGEQPADLNSPQAERGSDKPVVVTNDDEYCLSNELQQAQSRAAALLRSKVAATTTRTEADRLAEAPVPAGTQPGCTEEAASIAVVNDLEEDQPMVTNAGVAVTYQALPPRSKARLVTLLNEWACWHLENVGNSDGGNKFLLPIVKQIEAMQPSLSGRLELRPSQMGQGSKAAAVWMDTPDAPPSPPLKNALQPAPASFNIAYEQMGDEVPTYQRSAFHALGKQNAAFDPRTNQSVDPVPLGPVREAKRCFNCGSYGHDIWRCWKPRDRLSVDAAKKRQEVQKSASNRSKASNSRYFEGGSDTKGKAEDVETHEGFRLQLTSTAGTPGMLSTKLREALGIGDCAPPPWQKNMMQLGYPPGWLAPHASQLAAAINQSAVFVDLGHHASKELMDTWAQDSPESPVKSSREPSDVMEVTAATKASQRPQELASIPGMNAPLPEDANVMDWHRIMFPSAQGRKRGRSSNDLTHTDTCKPAKNPHHPTKKKQKAKSQESLLPMALPLTAAAQYQPQSRFASTQLPALSPHQLPQHPQHQAQLLPREHARQSGFTHPHHLTQQMPFGKNAIVLDGHQAQSAQWSGMTPGFSQSPQQSRWPQPGQSQWQPPLPPMAMGWGSQPRKPSRQRSPPPPPPPLPPGLPDWQPPPHHPPPPPPGYSATASHAPHPDLTLKHRHAHDQYYQPSANRY